LITASIRVTFAVAERATKGINHQDPQYVHAFKLVGKAGYG
jgi:hypothetical protein